MKFCTDCGTALEDGVKFCNECGKPVSAPAGSPTGAPAIAPENTVVHPPSHTTDHIPVSTPTSAPTHTPVHVPDHASPGTPAGPDANSPAIPQLSVPNPYQAPVMFQAEPAPEGDVNIEWKKNGRTILSWFKRHLWVPITAAALIVVLGALYFTGSYITDGSRLAAKFEKAVKAGDAEAVASMLKPGEKDFTITKETVKPLIELMKEDTAKRNEILDDIRAQAALYKKKNSSVVASSYADALIQIKKSGKQFLFFNDYDLQIKPVYVNVYTNYNGTKISVNGTEFATSDVDYYDGKIGPLMPGENTITAKYEGEYATLESEKVLTLDDPLEYYTADLELKGKEIYVTSNNRDAAIFIEGKDTGLTTSDFKGIGPITLDGSIKVHLEKEFPWGLVKSDAVPIDSEDINIDLVPANDAFRDSVQSAVRVFYEEYVTALNTLDISKASHMSKEVKEALSPIIDSFKEAHVVYNGKINKILFDMDSVEFFDWSDGCEASVSIQVHFSQSASLLGDPSSSTSEDGVYNETIKMTYDKDKWLVTDIYEDYYFDEGGNTEEVLL